MPLFGNYLNDLQPMNKSAPILLMILDGWGCDTPNQFNAISNANTPQWDNWLKHGQTTKLDASGHSVGLPDKQMGNSEVGHMHIGAGRVIKQNLSQISDDIFEGTFQKNPTLLKHIQHAKTHHKAIHLIGLVSEGGVHSHQQHLFALIDTLSQQGIEKAFIHAFLDGRDCPPQSAKSSIEALNNKITSTPYQLASISGRFFAMDRDKRWDRVKQTYDVLTKPQPQNTNTALDVIDDCYKQDIFDEFIPPTALNAHQPIMADDVVIFFNFRADRARQLSHALTSRQFDGFERAPFVPVSLLTMTQYDEAIDVDCIYPPTLPKNTLGECVAKAGLSQLRIAETEKYAHVTFFFNGGNEAPFPLEDRQLIASPKVKTYDLQPEMSCYELTDKLILAMHSGQYQLIVCNYANADMVGHTGDLAAAIKAIEALDACFVKLDKALYDTGFEVIITADHGNAETMFDEKNQTKHTAHTNHLVPFVYLGTRKLSLPKPNGNLTDIAPTLLSLMHIAIPSEMAGISFIKPTQTYE